MHGARLAALAAATLCCVVALPFAAVETQAQVVDFSRVSCAQFDRLPSGRKRQIALWLHGYYTGATQRPFLDMPGADAAIRALMEVCAEKPETPLLGEEVRAVLSGAATGGAPRTVERSPGHIVIEPSEPGAAPASPERRPAAIPERPRPID